MWALPPRGILNQSSPNIDRKTSYLIEITLNQTHRGEFTSCHHPKIICYVLSIPCPDRTTAGMFFTKTRNCAIKVTSYDSDSITMRLRGERWRDERAHEQWAYYVCSSDDRKLIESPETWTRLSNRQPKVRCSLPPTHTGLAFVVS